MRKINNQPDPDLVAPEIRQVLANDLLAGRRRRRPNYKAESEASAGMVKALLETPRTVLQSLVDSAVALTGADAAGISLVTRRDGADVFRWEATAGSFRALQGQLLARSLSPCGTVLEFDAMLLMVNPELAYGVAAAFDPPIREALLVPFHEQGQAVGTLWVVSQGDKQFCGQDARVITNLSALAAVAYGVLSRMDDMQLLNRSIMAVKEGRGGPDHPLH